MEVLGTTQSKRITLSQVTMSGLMIAFLAACSVATKEGGSSLESKTTGENRIGILNEVSNSDTLLSTSADALPGPVKPSGGGSAGVGNEGTNPDTPMQQILAGSETLHGIVEMRCSGCHNGSSAPKFYVPGNMSLTMTTIYGLDTEDPTKLSADNGKVSLAAPLKSLMLKKVAPDDFEVPSETEGQLPTKITGENHNCWSGDCQADAMAVLGAIREWAEATKDLRAKFEEEDSTPKSGVFKLAEATPAEARDAVNEAYKVQAEDAVAVGNWMDQVLAVGDGIARYNDDSCGNNLGFAAAAAGASLTFNFTDIKPGAYYVYISAAAAAGNMDSFYLNFNQTDYVHQVEQSGLVGEVRVGQASTNNMMANLIGVQMIAGTTMSISLACREAGARVDYIMLCPYDVDSMANCAASDPIPEMYTQVDVSELCGAPAAIAFRHFVATDGAYAFREPTLVDPSSTSTQMVPVSKAMTLKNLKIGVNKFFDATRSTFSAEYAVEAGTLEPFSGATVFVDADKGPAMDEISLSLDSCVVSE